MLKKLWITYRVVLAASVGVWLLVCGAFLRTGYFATLDMVFGPRSFGVLPAMPMQHVLIFFIFVGGVLAAYWALSQLTVKGNQANRIGLLLAALFYLYNPFVYQRFLAGHWRFLLGYAILPLVWGSTLRLLKSIRVVDAVVLSSGILTACLADAHYVFITVVPVVFLLLTVFLDYRRKKRSWREFALLLFSTTVAYGLVYLLSSRLRDTVAAFDLGNFYYYAGVPDQKYGLIYNFLTLHGFWREGREMLVIKDSMLWPFALFVLGSLLVLGIKKLFAERRVSFLLGFTFFSAFILSLGVSPYTWRLTLWLEEHVPYYVGMREPHKFLSLVVFVYGACLAWGFTLVSDWLGEKISSQAKLIRNGLGAVVLVALGGASIYMFDGFAGQIRLVDYTVMYEEADTYLQKNDPDAALVELPYELYIKYPFNNRYSASLLANYFHNPVIHSSFAGMQAPDEFIASCEDYFFACYFYGNVQCFKQAMQADRVDYLMYTKVKSPSISLTQLQADRDFELIYEDEYTAFFHLENYSQ